MKRNLLLILAALILALCGWLYTPDLSRQTLEKRYFTKDDRMVTPLGGRLRVRDTGPREAPVVLLLHGLGASLEAWEPWAETMSPQYRVIRIDLPGFGLSGAEPTGDYSDPRAVAMILEMLDELGVGAVTVMGHSLGGRIAWRLAADHPDRVTRLVLIAPDGFASPGFAYDKPAEVPLVARILPYVLPRFLLRANLAAAFSDPSRLTDALLDRYFDLLRAPGVRAALLDRLAQVRLQDPRPLLKQITAPVLLLWGQRDQMIPVANAADYQAVIAHCQVVVLPELGHDLFEEVPADSLAPVLEFLQQTRP